MANDNQLSTTDAAILLRAAEIESGTVDQTTDPGIVPLARAARVVAADPPSEPSHSGYLIAATPQAQRLSRATLKDIKFIDSLQKKFGRSLGFLPYEALEVNLEAGNVDLAMENDEPAGYLLCRPRLAWQPLLGSIVQAAVAMDAQRRHHGLALLLQVEERARRAGQVALQANCAIGVEANEFWAAAGFKPIAHLTPATVSGREIICWRKPLTRKLPSWFTMLPKQAGGRGLKVNSTRNLNRDSKSLDFAAKFATGKILVAGDPTHSANGFLTSPDQLTAGE
jgi:ribosomal protein S18 acetylase RimI-like enzyme